MDTVIYLSNQQVQIVAGTGTGKALNVKNCITEEAPEGSIINGIVMDNESFTEFIRTLRMQGKIPAKDVVLVVNSSKFIGKTIEMPKMNIKKTTAYIGREYQDVGRSEGAIYGYITLNEKGKFKKLYTEAIEPDFIKDYIEIFASAGVKVKGIYSGESTLIGFTGVTAGPHLKTFMLLVADANTLTTVLWVNGSFYYYNSVRCFHEQGTPEYADDIARSVSQINQFMKANQLEVHLEKIMLAGLDESIIPMCTQAISDAGIKYPVEAFGFKSMGRVDKYQQKYIRAVAGLIEYEKQSNYIKSLSTSIKEKESEAKEGQNRAILIIALAVLVMIGASVATYLIKVDRQKELDRLVNYNNAPEMLFQVGYYDTLMARNAFLIQQHESIVGLSESLDTYPRGNTKVLNIFNKCAEGYAEVTYQSFNAEEGSITITAMAEEVNSINKFIQNLTEQDIFSSVDYTGYTYEESTELWNINVTCILAESAGLNQSK